MTTKLAHVLTNRARVFGLLAGMLGFVAICVNSARFLTLPDRDAVLNGLRDEINVNYGFDENRFPRVNCGPCARFAILFRDKWNAKFGEKLNIACAMTTDRRNVVTWC